ncbi:phosphoribosylformylglycinamidine synthase subunit PurQ [Acetobacteraceae bacterium H6797]|nr:phosphoribosylformylglycinamidine synthase subunit PurQ [Acetobacteraceae bacterium H6797]
MRAAIIVFPGTNRERDMAIALKRVTGTAPAMVFHRETSLPQGTDLVVLPGGFSYGDYLRCGAMAAQSPIMKEIIAFANKGGHVLGVCNGFQMLVETGLLPGALLRNATLRFLSMDCHMRVERTDTPFTHRWNAGHVFRSPMAHGDGNYFCDAETLKALNAENRVVFRYTTPEGEVTAEANRNGSIDNIAGICSPNARILGLMPHPEDLVDPLMGGTDGLPLFTSLVDTFATA